MEMPAVRLAKLESAHTVPQRVLLLLSSVVSRSRPLDVVRVLMYRPEFFGAPFLDLGHSIMRGPSDWTVGERELFGAFTSSLNRCSF